MPKKRYFLRLSGAFILGLVAIGITSIIFILILPYMVAITLTSFFLILVFIITWAIVYASMMVGVAIYYIFKPMEVTRKDKGYKIEKTEEAGRRETEESED